MIEQTEDIYSMDTGRLYIEFIETIESKDLERQYNEEINLVENGVFIKFPIHKITKQQYIEYPNHNLVIVKGYRRYKDKHFYKEVDERSKLMRKIIIENEDEDKHEPRN